MWRTSSHRIVAFLFSNNVNSRAFCSHLDETDVVGGDPNIFGTLRENSLKSYSTATLKKSSFDITVKEIYPKDFKFNLESDDANYGRNQHLSLRESVLKSSAMLPEEQVDDSYKTEFAPRLPLQGYRTKLLDLCKQRKLHEAIEVFEEEMKEMKVTPDDFCYNTLITACGKAGFTDKAFQLYNKMKKQGLEPKKYAYTGLFNACANSPWPTSDGLERSRKLRKQLAEKQIQLTPITYHSMIKAFGHGGDIKTAFELADEMLEKGHRITGETFNFLFQACLSDKESGFRHALVTWNKLIKMRIKPTIHSYNLFLRCIKECKIGDPLLSSDLQNPFMELPSPAPPDKVILILDKNHEVTQIQSESEALVNHKVGVDEPIVSSDVTHPVQEMVKTPDKKALSMPRPSERLIFVGGVAGILHSMSKYKIEPNITTFSLLLDSLPNNFKMEEELLGRLESHKIKPDVIFCNKLIRRRCLRYALPQAKDILIYMNDHSIMPDLASFGCLAIGCHKRIDIKQLLIDMDRAGLRPNETILDILMRNAVRNRAYLLALNLLQKTRKYEINPSESMIKIHEEARKNIRDTIRLAEREEIEITDSERKEMQEYLLQYSSFLKKSKVQIPEHPWKQFGFDVDRDRFIKHS